MAKESIIIQPPSAGPPLQQVVIDGRTLNIFDDYVMRQTLSPPNITGEMLLNLSAQSGETQVILHALIRELANKGILERPAPPPGEDDVGKPMSGSALDGLALGTAPSDEERADAERETVRDPLLPKDAT